ncbi:hypothetical protein FPQ18DRAFT_127917 [Pyronema domesticum]|uniref:Uncharacterized protein n=1 Tax=Pyronema omphalodes (strain CBS 100304) TaxID=1076935 RepID=U4LTR3_PYROM|nr:hypothetical protein FPQ18DRAFT_127917 [Pyronema domesticum]CCX33045.1 Protein of unknown function [Pyronema omphalodes CBS 100304]
MPPPPPPPSAGGNRFLPTLPALAHRSLATVLNISQALLVAGQIIITPNNTSSNDTPDLAKQYLETLFTEVTLIFVAKLVSLTAVPGGVDEPGGGGGNGGRGGRQGRDGGKGSAGAGNGGSGGNIESAITATPAPTPAHLSAASAVNKTSRSSSSSSTFSHLSAVSAFTHLSAGSADINGIGSGGLFLSPSPFDTPLFPGTLSWPKLQALLLQDRGLISQFRCRKNYSARLSKEEVEFIRSAGVFPRPNGGVDESGEPREPVGPREHGRRGELDESGKPGELEGLEDKEMEEGMFEAYKITARYKMLLDAVDQLEGFDLAAYEMTVEVGKFLGKHFVGVKDGSNSSGSGSSSRPSSGSGSGQTRKEKHTSAGSSWFSTLTSKKKSTHTHSIPLSKLQKGGEFIPDASLPKAKKIVMTKYEGMFKGVGKLFETVKIWRELYAEFYGVEEEAWVVVGEESWKDS